MVFVKCKFYNCLFYFHGKCIGIFVGPSLDWKFSFTAWSQLWIWFDSDLSLPWLWSSSDIFLFSVVGQLVACSFTWHNFILVCAIADHPNNRDWFNLLPTVQTGFSQLQRCWVAGNPFLSIAWRLVDMEMCVQGLALENCPYCDATYLDFVFAAEVEGDVGRQTVFWSQEGHCKLSWPGEEHRAACHPFLPAFLFFLFLLFLIPGV